VIGAHYDHLGHGGEGSLAPGASAVHNGADDNASGVAGMLALAKAFSQAPPRRTVLFVAFGAEEEGLIGSKRFVAKFAKVAAMINMDMIGRLDGRKLLLGGYGSAKEWPAIVQHAVDATARAIAVQDDGFGPSDHASFYGEGVPVFFLWTGTHVDYHKPSDDTARIDEAGAEYCTRVAYHLARGIDARDALTYVKVPRKKSPRRVATGERRASFGSIPDYSQDGVVGVRLDGASAGGPAAKAGIKKGDVVVEFNGRKVVNIYDYTNALRESKPGETVSVVVERDGKRITLKATLVAR
jgi:membrane-associated protease RseP (regulator of RpoE activity)